MLVVRVREGGLRGVGVACTTRGRFAAKRVKRVGRVTRTVAHSIHDGGKVGMGTVLRIQARKREVRRVFDGDFPTEWRDMSA